MYSILVVVEYSIPALELTTPQGPRPHKSLQDSHDPSAGEDQCEHDRVGDQLSPGRLMVPTVLSLWLGSTSPFFPEYSAHSQGHVETVSQLDTILIMPPLLFALPVLDVLFPF